MVALIGSSTAHEDRCLERLESRTHKTQRLGIASLEQHPAPAIADGRVHPMARFDNSIPQQAHL
jgi:hypothetical protein